MVLARISASMQRAIDAQTERLTEASRFASNALGAIETVKCFNGQSVETRQYTKAIRLASKFYLAQARANALQIGVVRFMTLSMFVQGFWYGSYLVSTGRRNPGQVLTAFWACLQATQTMEQILPQMLVLERGKSAGSTLKTVLDQIVKGGKMNAIGGDRIPPYCEGDVQISDVSGNFYIIKTRANPREGVVSVCFKTR